MGKTGLSSRKPVFLINPYLCNHGSKAVEALRKVNLSNHSEGKISGYSAGMKIRLGID
ncbi:MAG: hypothetical protein QXN75_03735 [Thermoproteota archaeon]